MPNQGENTDGLPVVYVDMRKGQSHYGQLKNNGSRPSLAQISPVDFANLINSRIQRRTFAGIFRVLSILIPATVIIFNYILDNKVSTSAFVPYIAVGVAGFLVAQVINYFEIKARTTTLNYKLDRASKEIFRPLHTALGKALNSDRVWSIDVRTATSDWKRQAGASNLVKRRVVDRKKPPPFLKTDFPVLGMSHGQNTRIYFFPDRLYIYYGGKYSMINYSDCKVLAVPTRFVEDETVPSDARQIDTTWRYVRRDGGPDRRFNNNRQLPVMQYCLVTFSAQNLAANLEFHMSSVERGLKFARAFSDYSQRKR